MKTTQHILDEREQQHGNYDSFATIYGGLRKVSDPHAEKLTWPQQIAVEMMLFKIARILNNGANHQDNYQDIAGYAMLGGGLYNPNVPAEVKALPKPLTDEERESELFGEVEQVIEPPTLVENNGWISIEDKLPPIETDVLGLCDISGMQLILIVSRELADNEWYFLSVNQYGLDDDVIEVTHWQPLPKLPKDNQ
ncbi:DUF6378 domain-containing protein [Mannheimia haemolytica]|uniref:DUF6378 domain-containing protein n=1 Tax=Mannheimia haemolytica TaxID=75985 RepID=UPI0003857C9E|nr:DUF6378 domain-containing protein [Mannheimia haemolytica]EPZ00347.1 hypothetical protein L278_06645 [Mannheimia haemolytica D35]MDW1150539.1 DUF6378 domain-containing protein [Mannheimia haemolytica]MDW1160697.1 DUF6378 domain-containing protein [Mannheimia haemolytica]